MLVSGDSALGAEAKALLGESVTTVVVKEAVSRHAARSIAPTLACQKIGAAAQTALARKGVPFVIAPPLSLEVDFSSTVEADMAEILPGSRRLSARTVSYQHDDYRELFRAWRAMYNLAR
jgi:D-amino peptidase